VRRFFLERSVISFERDFCFENRKFIRRKKEVHSVSFKKINQNMFHWSSRRCSASFLRPTTVCRLLEIFRFPLFKNGALVPNFDSAEEFHHRLDKSYTNTSKDDPFSDICHRHGQAGKYYMITGPVSFDDKLFPGCKRVPFLVATDFPQSLIHEYTLKQFNPEIEIPQDIIKNGLKVRIGGRDGFYLNVHQTDNNSKQNAHLAWVNILGLDYLERAVPNLANYLDENIKKYQPPLEYVIVTDGVISILVHPKKPIVMHLKQAIKKELSPELNDIDADQLIIKDPSNNNKVMHDEDPILANIEYIFEVPESKKD
jgi:hypothetical protein